MFWKLNLDAYIVVILGLDSGILYYLTNDKLPEVASKGKNDNEDKHNSPEATSFGSVENWPHYVER